MQQELHALSSNNTWQIVPLPPGKSPIGYKWLYRIKFKTNGSVEMYKARLVAKGYTQKASIDYLDTFSPVAKFVSVKLMLAIAAAKNYSLHHLDINNAFLHGDLNEELYMDIPKGYQVQGETQRMVCKLNKSLYGLKQASRQWFLKFSSVLMNFSLQKSGADHSYFYKHDHGLYLGIIIYVDDLLIACNHPPLVQEFKTYLGKHVKYKDLGTPQYFLGLEINITANGISLCQRKYILDLLADTGLTGCKSHTTPMEFSNHLELCDKDLLPDPKLYRRLIGRLLYLGFTKLDITFSINKLSQFLAKPCSYHLKAAHRVLKYLKGTTDLGLHYSKNSTLSPSIYADADWGTCSDTLRSVTGYCLFIGDSIISWKSKKQHTVSCSSAEAEYRAMAHATCEVVWIDILLRDFGIPKLKAIPLFCDNKAAIYITSNPVFHERTKHIEIVCHTIRERYVAGLIKPLHVRADMQPMF